MSLLLEDIAAQAALLRTTLHNPALEQAALLVRSASAVRYAGIGSSRHVAAYGAACHEALHAGVASVLAAPGAGVPQPATHGDQALVLVSQSGATPGLLELALTARAGGARIVTVTNVPGSPLADLADVAIECGAGVESVVPATKSVTTSMLLLRAMAHPVEPHSVAACADAIETLVAQGVQDVTAVPGFVVAGGLAGQAVADEVALKLAEVAAVAAVPESLVDFLHGPAAVTAPVLALIEGDDPNLGALVTRPDVRLLHVPRSGDRSLDRITQLVAGQLFAVALADFLGVDADDPKGLSKVTLTR